MDNWQLTPENYEGWRVIVDEGDSLKGWCLLRSSIHDPICVLNVESEVNGGEPWFPSNAIDHCATKVGIGLGDSMFIIAGVP